MDFDYSTILCRKLYSKISATVPKDLKTTLLLLKKIKRFQLDDYPKGAIIDDTWTHTIKCFYIGSIIKPFNNTEKLTRILLIHDIPEVLTNDITVIERLNDPKKAHKTYVSEIKAAKTLLNTKDFLLFKKFMKASKFIKGAEKYSKDIDIDSILANIIDKAEGNMTFHYFVTKWIRSKNYDQTKLPPRISFEYTFKTDQNILKQVNRYLKTSDAKLISKFINEVHRNIGSMWEKVTVGKVPSVMRSYLYTRD